MKIQMMVLMMMVFSLGVVVAEVVVDYIPKDETFNSNLPTDVKNRLDDDIRNVYWHDEVRIEDGRVWGSLGWEWNNGSVWRGQNKSLLLWTIGDEKYCVSETFDGLCSQWGEYSFEEMLEREMVHEADKFLMKKYRAFPDIVDIQTVEVGTKDIKIKNELQF